MRQKNKKNEIMRENTKNHEIMRQNNKKQRKKSKDPFEEENSQREKSDVLLFQSILLTRHHIYCCSNIHSISC